MVPEGWETWKMSEILERVTDPVSPNPNEFYREIGIRSHGKGIFHKASVAGKSLGNKRVFRICPNCFIVNIVFAWEQAIAKTTSSELGMIASHRFPMFQPKQNRCNIDFVLYYFKTPRGKYLLGLASPGGAGRNKTLGQGEFARLEMMIPPLPEQTKIAQILSIWDKAIATTEQLLSNSQQQKKALMQQLLTGKKRFPGFEGEWVEAHLGDICTINPRKYPRPFDGKVTFVPMDAVTEDARLIRYETREYSEVERGFTSFAENDVLIAKITPCFENGKGAFAYNLANGIGFGSTEFHILRANPNVFPKFIYYLTNSREFRIRGEANMQGSAGQRRVPTDYLRCYKLRIPPLLKDQQKIASVLSSVDREIETLQQKLDNLKQEKKALMQQLLTGKRRVKT